MPRKPKKSPDEIYTALEGINFVSEDAFLPYSHAVWQLAADQLRNELSKDYVYLYVTQNRNNIAQRLCGENMPVDKTAITKKQCSESADLNWSMPDDDNPLPPLREKLSISYDQWMKISPIDVVYQGRSYEVLKPGWTSLIYEELWNKLKLPCTFQFKNAKINNLPGDVYLKIRGKCSECNTLINLYSSGYPSDKGIDLNISTNDTRALAHTKKRQLRAPLRREIAEKLQGKSTFTWRRDECNRLMEFGDVEPANIPSEAVLRKAKQQHRDAELGLTNITNPIESLQKLKYSCEFVGSIHEIALDKFYAMYWSPEQTFLYKHLLKNGNIDSVSIDATGSLIKAIPKPDGSKRAIFLYQVVTPIGGKILPICQFVSEKHDANTLSYWLREWLRCCVKAPKEVVTDYSLALINAVCLAFNSTDLLSYVNNCVNTLLEADLPKCDFCALRIDIAHLIKLVCRWPCFKKKFPAIKDFFVRCVALLSTTTTITEFRQLCTDVLIVAFSGTEDLDDKTNRCFAAQKRLINLMKGRKETDLHIPTEEGNTMLATFEDVNDVEPSNTESKYNVIDSFLTSLKSDSEPDGGGSRPNPYYCPDFGNRLLRLSKHFVLWTAVMTSVSGKDGKTPCIRSSVASSACSEEYFRELKLLVMKGVHSTRVDKFLVIHLKSISGTAKLLAALSSVSKEVAQADLSTYSSRETVAERNSLAVPLEDNFDSTRNSEIGIYNDSVNDESADHTTVADEPSISIISNVSNDTSGTMDGNILTENAFDGSLQLNVRSLLTKYSDVTANLESSKDNSTDYIAPTDDLPSPTITNVRISDERPESKNEETCHTLLSETENWKGKCDEKKRRGKYLKPCANIDQLHKRPRIQREIPLLLNGLALPPIRTTQGILKLIYTCPFDSIIQCIAAQYYDCVQYNEFVTASSHPTMEFVKSFAHFGATQKIYISRANMLLDIFTPKCRQLDCKGNVSILITKLFSGIPSLRTSEICQTCEHRENYDNIVLDANTIPLYTNGIKGLQKSVEHYYVRERSRCKKCKSASILQLHEVGAHIFIDIEALEWGLLADRLGHKDKHCQTFTVAELPTELEILKHKFNLAGAIEFIPGSPVGHYRTYVRRITNQWELHDDVHSSKKPFPVTARARLQKQRFHVLFYVKV